MALLCTLAVTAAACGPKDVAEDAFRSDSTPGGFAAAAAPDVVADEEVATSGGEVVTSEGVATAEPRRRSSAAADGSTARDATSSGGGDARASSAAAPRDVPGVDDDEIRIGVHVPETISGINLSAVIPLREAINAYWSARNAEGGIHGRRVKAFISDDRYNPSGAIEACKDLIARDVFFIYGAAGADQIVACGQYTLQQGRPYLSAGVAEDGLRGRPGYWALTMTYPPMSALLAEYAVAKLNGRARPMAVLRMNTPNAEGARRGFVDRARELGAEVVVDDAVDKDPNPAQLQAECLKMQQRGVEIVYVMASGLVMAQAADACAEQAYNPQWLGVANTGACEIQPPLGSPNLDGCVTLSAYHHPEDTDTALEQQARRDWERAYPGEEFPADDAMLVWGLSDHLREALERAGPDIDVQGFNETMAGFSYDNGFMNPLDFRGGTQVGGVGVVLWQAKRSASRAVEIDSTWRNDFGL